MRRFLTDSSLPLTYRAAGAFTVLFPVCYVIGSAAADVAAVLVSLLFLYESFRTSQWAWLKRGWVLFTLALWGYFTLRGAFAEDAGAAIGRAAAWIRYPLFAMALAFFTLRNREVERLLFWSLGVSLFFIMLDSLIQFQFGRDIFGRLPLMSAEGSFRLTGPFKDPKVGVVLAWLGFPVLAGVLFSFRRYRFVAAGLFMLLLLLVVFMSGERMALLLTLFGGGLLALSRKALWKPALAVVLLGALAVGVVAETNPALINRQYASTVETIRHYKESPYGQIWQSSVTMIAAHPIFGVGGKHFRFLCPRPEYGAMETVDVRCNLHPHQLYLEWLVEGGAVALLLFAALLVALFKDVLVARASQWNDPFYVGLLVAVLIRVWPLSTSTSFFVAWSALPFWLVAGWLLAVAYRFSPEQEKEF